MDLIATLRSFLRVAETGSFSAVAAERGMTQPAISRQVSALEEHLGTRLVHRTTQAVTLTEEGRELVTSARELVDAADAMLQSAAHKRGKPVGAVRIAISIAGGLHLARHIGRLLDQHDELSVELVLRDRYGNLVEEGLDAEIRVGETADSTLISRRIGSTVPVLVASPAYLDGKQLPTHPRDLERHSCIVHHREGSDDVWWFTHPDPANKDEISVPVRGRFGANNAAVVHRAALEGEGIASLSQFIVTEDIEAGRLRRLLPDYRCRRHPVYIDYPSRRNIPPRARVVIEYVSQLWRDRELLPPE